MVSHRNAWSTWKVLAACVGALLPSAAGAAQITEVADAADVETIAGVEREDPWDVNVTSRFEMDIERGKITREPIDRPGIQNDCTASAPRACFPVDELSYKGSTMGVRLALEMGIFHDLSATFGWKYYVGDTVKFDYAKGVTAEASSIDPQTGDPNDTLFAHDFESKHAGSGPLEFGLRWAPLSDLRDDTKPTWVLSVLWSAPWTASAYNPEKRASVASPGSMGDGVHRITFGTSFSKRMGEFAALALDPAANRRGYLDPYMSFAYTLPAPERGRAQPELVHSSSNPFGRKPSHVADIRAGVEIIPLEDLKNQRKVAIDLGFLGNYFSEGRNYSVLTDPLTELTYTEQHFRVGGLLGLNIQAAEFLSLTGGVSLVYDTEHFLTFEEVGKDKDGDGEVLGNGTDELNPYFCGNAPTDDPDLCQLKSAASYDQVGFRFKEQDHSIFSWFLGMALTF